jgi:hypothetical protein
MVYAYIVGTQFLDKEFESFEAALESMKKLQAVPHTEKVMWVISERQLTNKEVLILAAVQHEV